MRGLGLMVPLDDNFIVIYPILGITESKNNWEKDIEPEEILKNNAFLSMKRSKQYTINAHLPCSKQSESPVYHQRNISSRVNGGVFTLENMNFSVDGSQRKINHLTGKKDFVFTPSKLLNLQNKMREGFASSLIKRTPLRYKPNKLFKMNNDLLQRIISIPQSPSDSVEISNTMKHLNNR